MILPLIITSEAEDDLLDARKQYERKRKGLGEEFTLCVEESFDRIQLFPLSGSEVYPGVRRVVVRRFPYGVFYRVDSNQIAIIAVYHGHRDPRGWQYRV
jgi:toxin ParE1/3/4